MDFFDLAASYFASKPSGGSDEINPEITNLTFRYFLRYWYIPGMNLAANNGLVMKTFY